MIKLKVSKTTMKPGLKFMGVPAFSGKKTIYTIEEVTFPAKTNVVVETDGQYSKVADMPNDKVYVKARAGKKGPVMNFMYRLGETIFLPE